jgi:hypothetical protein
LDTTTSYPPSLFPFEATARILAAVQFRPEKVIMDLDQAIRYAWSGRAVMFAGAGFSGGALNLRDEVLKNGSQLYSRA